MNIPRCTKGKEGTRSSNTSLLYKPKLYFKIDSEIPSFELEKAAYDIPLDPKEDDFVKSFLKVSLNKIFLEN